MARAPTKKKPKSPAQRMADYRGRMRAQGFRPVTRWVREMTPERKADIARQCKELAAIYKREGDEMQDFIDAVSDWSDD